jgi:hypothetical protein
MHQFDAVFESLVMVIETLWRAKDPTQRPLCAAIIRLMSWTAERGLSRREECTNDEMPCFYDNS